MSVAGLSERSTGVYIHWPFCASKCPYCDFNSHVSDTIDHGAWAQAYIKELDYIAEKADKKHLTSIFFGGGTPSLMQPDTVAKIIDHAQRKFTFANDIEITLEANPTSIEINKFKDFKVAGVNRVSIGVQSLREKDLKFLGREHSVDEAKKSLKIANDVFDRVSFDLIYARPEQNLEDWEEELREALEYSSGHLSLYQLTIEPQTPFYTLHNRGHFQMPSSDQAGEFYELTQNIMAANDLPSYEVSNHAKAGQQSVHNLAYWRYEDYIGIGPGAHGRVTINSQKFATRTHRAPDVWLKKASNTHGYHPFEELSTEDQVTETLMMGLRLEGGIAFKKDLFDYIDAEKLQKMTEEGFLCIEENVLKPTPQGMQRLNSVLSYLL